MIEPALDRIPLETKRVVFPSTDIGPAPGARNRDGCAPREEVHTPAGRLVHKYLLGTYNMPGAILGTEDTAENPALTNGHRRGMRDIKKKNMCQYYVKCAYRIDE